MRGRIGLIARFDSADHVGFSPVHQLVCDALEAVGQRRGMRRLQLARLGEAARADQFDGLGDDRGEAVIVLAERLQQADLVLRHKLQSIDIVAELIELTQRGRQRELVRRKQR